MPRSLPEQAERTPPGANRTPLTNAGLFRVLERLCTRRPGLFAAVLGIILTIPALWTGFSQDDHFFLMVFQGCPGLEFLDLSPLETYSFSKGDPKIQPQLVEHGFAPWWVVDGWKVSFWRPLSSLSNWIDYLAFGERAWIMHLHSLLLYGVLILAAAALYRRFIPSRRAAGLAALLFAVDSGHAVPAAWLSMRNALLTLLFGLLAMRAHDLWRRHGRPWRTQGPLALVWLAFALLSGEAAVAVGGYLFAYAVFLDPAAGSRTWRGYAAGIAALLPYLGVVIVWRLAYTGLGYGTEGSGLYIDPVASPVEFAERLPARLAVSLLGLFALPDATLWGLVPTTLGHVLLAAAALFLILATRAFAPLLRERGEARFLLLGALLSIVPACATLPMDRNLTYPSFGALGLVAMYLAGQWEGCAPRSRFHRAVAGFLLFAHLVVAPLGLAANTQQIRVMDRILTGSNPTLPMGLPESTRIISLNMPSDLLGASFPVQRSSRREPVRAHWWWLYAGVRDLEVERIDDRTLILRPEAGFLTSPWADIFRFPDSHPLRAGDRFTLSGVSIEVRAVTPDGRPAEASFTFDAPLEDPSLFFVTWQDGAYHAFEPPRPGDSVRVAGPELLRLLRVGAGWR